MKPWRQHVLQLGHLALPLALVQLNNNLTGAVDTAMAGRVDQLTLGATGLGASIFILVAVVGMGAGLGCDPLIAQAFGRGDALAARRLMGQGLWVALVISIPLMLLAYLLAGHLKTLGVHHEVATEAAYYLYGRLPCVPLHCAAMVLRSYLQAARLTRPVLMSALVMNLFNVVADWLLLFGDAGLIRLGLPALGLPALGVFGLGLASGLATCVQLAYLSRAVYRFRVPAAGAASLWRLDLLHFKQILGLGTPAGMQMLAEMGVFTLVSVLMGGMGAVAAAAHQTAIMLASLSFSVCVGIGAATSVYVGRAVGRADSEAVFLGGLAGLFWGGVAMALSASAMWCFPKTLVRFMTDDVAVLEPAVRLLRIAGFFQIADGAQAVATGALRGTGRTGWPLAANMFAYYGVALPVGGYLTYHCALGPEGLWWGLSAGLMAVAIVLCVYFWRLSQKPLQELTLQ